MSILTKALGIWAMSKTVSSTTILMRLLLGMAAITMLAVFTAVLAAMLLGVLVWILYTQLIAHGIAANLAMVIIGLVLLAIFFAIIIVAQHYWSKLQNLCQKLMHVQSPIGSRVNELSEAFMGGFNTK